VLNGGGALTIAGGTLMGNGSTTGTLTVNPAGTVAPGESVGKFTASGAVTLQGTNVMEIDRDGGTNDVLQGSSIAYGGTLSVSSLNSAFQTGDSFKLFHATGSSYTGSFGSIIPSEPGVGLAWDTSSLNVNGTLKVVSVGAPQPQINSVVLSGSNLLISGVNGPNSGDYYVLSSTDIGLPVASWQSIATNSFSGGSFNFSTPVNFGEGKRFYLIQVP
jgi:hypothetical protein